MVTRFLMEGAWESRVFSCGEDADAKDEVEGKYGCERDALLRWYGEYGTEPEEADGDGDGELGGGAHISAWTTTGYSTSRSPKAMCRVGG
jgi:hypothetical protein